MCYLPLYVIKCLAAGSPFPLLARHLGDLDSNLFADYPLQLWVGPLGMATGELHPKRKRIAPEDL